MKLICAMMGHRRSRKQAYRTDSFAGWKSRCRTCGKPMVRVAPQEWRLAADCERPRPAPPANV